jgi:hypothetical protein
MKSSTLTGENMFRERVDSIAEENGWKKIALTEFSKPGYEVKISRNGNFELATVHPEFGGREVPYYYYFEGSVGPKYFAIIQYVLCNAEEIVSDYYDSEKLKCESEQ